MKKYLSGIVICVLMLFTFTIIPPYSSIGQEKDPIERMSRKQLRDFVRNQIVEIATLRKEIETVREQKREVDTVKHTTTIVKTAPSKIKIDDQKLISEIKAMFDNMSLERAEYNKVQNSLISSLMKSIDTTGRKYLAQGLSTQQLIIKLDSLQRATLVKDERIDALLSYAKKREVDNSMLKQRIDELEDKLFTKEKFNEFKINSLGFFRKLAWVFGIAFFLLVFGKAYMVYKNRQVGRKTQ